MRTFICIIPLIALTLMGFSQVELEESIINSLRDVDTTGFFDTLEIVGLSPINCNEVFSKKYTRDTGYLIKYRRELIEADRFGSSLDAERYRESIKESIERLEHSIPETEAFMNAYYEENSCYRAEIYFTVNLPDDFDMASVINPEGLNKNLIM